MWWYARHGTGLRNNWKPLGKRKELLFYSFELASKDDLLAFPELTACTCHLHLPVKGKLLNSTCQRGALSLKMCYFSSGSSQSVGACGSPGPHFHPADPGGADDINLCAFRNSGLQGAEGNELPPSHFKGMVWSWGGARITPAEAEFDHTRYPGAPPGDDHFPFSLYQIALFNDSKKTGTQSWMEPEGHGAHLPPLGWHLQVLPTWKHLLVSQMFSYFGLGGKACHKLMLGQLPLSPQWGEQGAA